MFRKLLIIAMFATAAGYCFASESGLPEVTTSEVFYRENADANVRYAAPAEYEVMEYAPAEAVAVPTWPIVGSDADVYVTCGDGGTECSNKKSADNIRIVSKIGDDVLVDNEYNAGPRVAGEGWSGGANMLHGSQIPTGFLDECANGIEMPLMRREMLEDDGGAVLAMSRSTRARCGYGSGYSDGYAALGAMMGETSMTESNDVEKFNAEFATMDVDPAADEAPKMLSDSVRSWVVASGQTLHNVLQEWADKEGWDLVWATAREYPIEASAVFKGRFVDVASALVRNFGRATPVPYAKFYKGNRVLVVSTTEE